MPAHEYSSLETKLRVLTRISSPLMTGTGLLLTIRLLLREAALIDIICAGIITIAGAGFTVRPYLPRLQAMLSNRWIRRSRS